VSYNWPKAVAYAAVIPVIVGGVVVVNIWTKHSPVIEDWNAKQQPRVVEIVREVPVPTADPKQAARIKFLEEQAAEMSVRSAKLSLKIDELVQERTAWDSKLFAQKQNVIRLQRELNSCESSRRSVQQD